MHKPQARPSARVVLAWFKALRFKCINQIFNMRAMQTGSWRATPRLALQINHARAKRARALAGLNRCLQ